MVCNNCGENLAEGKQFCPSCGTSATGGSGAAPSEKKKKKPLKTLGNIEPPHFVQTAQKSPPL